MSIGGKRSVSCIDSSTVKTHEPLRVSLEDLHSAESKGKWWLVGAAWGGDPLVDRQQDASATDSSTKKVESTENVLQKLAKKQGMNTDIRRSIFVVLMSSEVSTLISLMNMLLKENAPRTMSTPANVFLSSS